MRSNLPVTNRQALYRAEEERDRLKAGGAPKDVIEAADEVIFAATVGGRAPSWAVERLRRYAQRGQYVNRFGRTA